MQPFHKTYQFHSMGKTKLNFMSMSYESILFCDSVILWNIWSAIPLNRTAKPAGQKNFHPIIKIFVHESKKNVHLNVTGKITCSGNDVFPQTAAKLFSIGVPVNSYLSRYITY